MWERHSLWPLVVLVKLWQLGWSTAFGDHSSVTVSHWLAPWHYWRPRVERRSKPEGFSRLVRTNLHLLSDVLGAAIKLVLLPDLMAARCIQSAAELRKLVTTVLSCCPASP